MSDQQYARWRDVAHACPLCPISRPARTECSVCRGAGVVDDETIAAYMAAVAARDPRTEGGAPR